MTWLHMRMAVLDAATAAAEFGVNWFVQSTILIAIGLVAGRLLRRHGSAVQSAIYRTTLAAVLVCPIASWMLSLAGVSGWSMAMPQPWSYEQSQTIIADAPLPVLEAAPTSLPVVVSAASSAPLRAASDTPSELRRNRVDVQASPLYPMTPPADPRTFSVHPSGWLALGIGGAWLLISTVLITRLAIAWWRLSGLCRSAAPATARTRLTCRELAAQLAVAAPEVLRSPYVPSPCLAGLRRPVVLLPEVELSLSIRDVLIHELAHLCRRDCHWNLLRQLALSAFFFQPLLWMLSRRLEAAAEEVCDDFVLLYGGDRQEYAHRLVDVAELSIAPMAAAGVGIVSLRSMLARRVQRIVDTSRSLSTRVGNLLLFLVLAAGLIGTTFVGLVGISQQQSVAKAASAPNQGESTDGGHSAKEKKMRKYAGQVLGPSGTSVANAHVAAFAARIGPARGGDLTSRGETLAETKTDSDGHYQLSIDGATSKTHRSANLIARKGGYGIAWQQLDIDADASDAALALAPEEPIRGRLVDVEGKPAAGVRMSVQSVVKTSEGLFSQEGVGYQGADKPPAAWLQRVTSDAEGRFTLNGVPAGHGVWLEVTGTDRFAPQEIALNTGMLEKRGKGDGTYRPLVKNAAPGEEAVLPLAPAQFFEGLVTYEDSGRPAGHARLEIWASQENSGSMSSVDGKADDRGRYRISAHPGVRFGINAYPPDGSAAYLARRTPYSAAIWKTGDRVKRVDVKLPRGVLVRGTVVESGTNAPIAVASIQYHPEGANNPHKLEHILTGWQDIHLSDEQGKFEIAVLPKPGRLLVHGAQAKYVMRETSTEELNQGKPGGQRYYAHAIQRIEPAPGADSIEVSIPIRPGATIAGRLVDEQGNNINEALVISRFNVSPHHLEWPGHVTPTLGGKFELSGLDRDHEYTVHFLDAKRRLGAKKMLRSDSTDLTVVLKPCGQASARFVNSKGEPQAGFQSLLRMVDVPGEHEHDPEAGKAGKLVADAAFVANIDQANHWPIAETDNQGRITLPALIPGATYRIDTYKGGKQRVLKQFSVKSDEQLDLGEIPIDVSQ